VEKHRVLIRFPSPNFDFMPKFVTFYVRGPSEKFVDWWQCTAVMQREAVTVIPSCSGGGNVVVA
jgi:hypothetical protein